MTWVSQTCRALVNLSSPKFSSRVNQKTSNDDCLCSACKCRKIREQTNNPPPTGGEIRTPNIDKLAKNGIRFTDFHAAAACSPTRAMLLTGTDHHIAGLGNLIEWTNASGQNAPKGSKFDTGPQRGMPGYEGYLNDRVVTLPEILRDGGYQTLMAGKWHLGLTPERSPTARGFERAFAHLPACSNHYGYEPQLERPDKIPNFMEMSMIALHSEDGEYVKELPENWYSSNGYGDKLLQYLEERRQKNDDRPFFAYLPFTAPHWPLQAPQELIAHYRGVYDDGPESLRQRRLQRLKDLGMIAQDVEPHPVVADEVKPWEDLTPLQRAKSCRAMECFAGMVEAIDINVGRVIDSLQESGDLENTMICFMSDNGAEGAAYEAYPIVQSNMLGHLQKYYDNSLENMGNKDSFVWYGPRWAQAATAPSRLYKAHTTEGGVRVPFVVQVPRSMRQEPAATIATDEQTAHPSPSEGLITHEFATVMDLAPTILSMASLSHPSPTYKSRPVVPMRGVSMLPFLSSPLPASPSSLSSSYPHVTHDPHLGRIHPTTHIHGWETAGRCALRHGTYKIVFIPRPKGPERWQLYDLSVDPGEVHDLSSQETYKGKMEEMMGYWERWVKECGVVPLAPEVGEFLEATEAQMEEGVWIEYEYWKDGARERPEEFRREVQKFSKGEGESEVVFAVDV